MSGIYIDGNFVFGFGDKFTDTPDKIERELRSKGYGFLRLISAKQTHSVEILTISKLSDSETDLSGFDGIITALPNIVLAVKTADCVPVMLYDSEQGIAGIVHSGWRGSYENIIDKMIMEFFKHKSNLKKLKAHIGPSIGPCCYPIYGDRYDQICRRYPNYRERIFPVYDAKVRLDLRQLIWLQLTDSGVSADNIGCHVSCTSCQHDKYYSYRRGDRGRHMLHFILRSL